MSDSAKLLNLLKLTFTVFAFGVLLPSHSHAEGGGGAGACFGAATTGLQAAGCQSLGELSISVSSYQTLDQNVMAAKQSCQTEYYSCKSAQASSQATALGAGSSTVEGTAGEGAESQATGTGIFKGLGSALSFKDANVCEQMANACMAKAEGIKANVNTFNSNMWNEYNTVKTGMEPAQANALGAKVSSCESQISTQFQQFATQAQTCLTAMGVDSKSSLLTGLFSMKGAALALGAAGLLKASGVLDKDDDEESGGGGNNGFSITEQSEEDGGGQCLSYGQNESQKKCYSNSELSAMCYKGSAQNQYTAQLNAYAATGMAANTQKMEDALCTAFKADTRDGGGGDENTCHTRKPEYYKDEACKSRMISQCQSTEFGDCAVFNSHFCHNEEEEQGQGSNYCVFREASLFCQNSQNSNTPACAWVRQVRSTMGESSSCISNVDQVACYPKTYGSIEALTEACKTMDIITTDPLCKNIANDKTYFSWRNPTLPGGGTSSSTGTENDTDITSTQASTRSCSQPSVDCAKSEYRDTPACISYYCCKEINSAAPICQSIGSSGVAGSIKSYGSGKMSISSAGAARYPAGSLPTDIISYRGESLFTTTDRNSMATRLCSQGQLYDCGSLRGYVPRR